LTDIFVDSTLKIIGHDMKALVQFTEKMNALSTQADTKISLLVSASKEELPEEIRSFSVQS